MSDKPSINIENIEQCNLTTSDHGVKNEKILGDSCPTDTEQAQIPPKVVVESCESKKDRESPRNNIQMITKVPAFIKHK
jgi:hypothetical protein